MSYETFAFVYDEVMDSSLYQQWLDFSNRHFPKETERILELACGTGALAIAFSKAGYNVTALDLSEDMLSVASERAVEQEASVQFVSGDMMDLSEVGLYQGITCYSDSLCYMEDEHAVQQVFDTVYEALEEGGVFLFDVHSIYQVTTIFPEYSYHYQTDEFAFLWDSYVGDEKYSIEHFLTFFLKNQQNNQFTRYDELHKERTYPIETYILLLENAGFSNLKVYSDFSDEEPSEESARWFFVCTK